LPLVTQLRSGLGGVWNGVFLSGPPVELTLVRSKVTRNALTVTSGGERQGGGIFKSELLDLRRTRVVGNRPDQCFGC
jgi:hypothetical protein